MRKTKFILIFLFAATVRGAFAQGWNDFELPIGNGYSIVRANSFDVMLVHDDGSIIISNDKFDAIGPITGYYKNPKSIFVRTAGMKMRKLFPGDDFREADSSRQFFFVISSADRRVDGPLSESEFLAKSSVASRRDFAWLVPENPNVWKPLFGTFVFMIVSVPILYLKFFYVTLPVTAAAMWLWWQKRQNRYMETSR